MSHSSPTILFVLSSDLFFPSRIQATARSQGIKSQLLTQASGLNSVPNHSTLIIDLEVSGLDFEELKSLIEANHLKAIGYAPHVKTNLFQSGKSAGLSHIYTRGQINESLSKIISGLYFD